MEDFDDKLEAGLTLLGAVAGRVRDGSKGAHFKLPNILLLLARAYDACLKGLRLPFAMSP